jgi:membrane protease YdiL (CAAX protease family)
LKNAAVSAICRSETTNMSRTSLKHFFLILFFAAGLCSSLAKPILAAETQKSPFELQFEPDRPRNFIFPPLFSLVLPGLDQYMESQTGYGFAYTGIALLGVGLDLGFQDPNTDAIPSITTQDNRSRMRLLGAQLQFVAGEMSAYHSFRTAVRSRQNQGEFLFLKHEESPVDLALAPFQFGKYISRPTTYVGLPAMLAMGLIVEKIKNSSSWVSDQWHWPSASDYAFAGAFSVNAGVGEEALFRGWLMPLSMHYTDSEWVSNAITSVVFGAVHYSSENKFPISQTIGGYYLGYVAQKNEWQLGESIFIHTWFDVAAFLLTYATTEKDQPKPAFLFSPISFAF